jgi:hypothetical protein
MRGCSSRPSYLPSLLPSVPMRASAASGFVMRILYLVILARVFSSGPIGMGTMTKSPLSNEVLAMVLMKETIGGVVVERGLAGTEHVVHDFWGDSCRDDVGGCHVFGFEAVVRDGTPHLLVGYLG